MINHTFRPHPITAVNYLKRLLPLLIIPVVSSAYRFILHGYSFSSTLWDVLAAAISVLWAYLECKSISVVVKKGRIFVKKGLIFKSEWSISTDRLTALYTEYSLLSVLFGAVKVRLETKAGRGKRSDFWFYVNRQDAKRLAYCITGFEGKSAKRSSIWQSVLLALSETSAWSGLLIFATAINYLGRFLGRRLDAEVINGLTDTAKSVGLLIPPITALIAELILLGFAFSFGVALLRNSSHAAQQSRNIICIKQGLLWRKYAYIFKDNIAAVTSVSSPVLALFGRKNVRVNVGGYDNKQEGESVLPAIKASANSPDSSEVSIKNPKRASGRVIKVPLTLTAVDLALWGIFVYHMPDLSMLWAIIFLSLGAICLYRLKVKLAGVKKGSIAFDRSVRVNYPKRLTYYDSSISTEQIDSVTLRQTPFDLNHKMCTVTVNVVNKNKSRFSAANLDIDDTVKTIKDCL